MGLIPQRDYFDKDIANSDNTNGYYIIEHDDFVYNPRKSSDAPYGPISRYAYSDAGIVSPLYLCFRAKGNVDTNFFEWYFHSSAWHRYIYMTGDSGARHDRVSIKDADFFSMPIRFPSAIEQKKIAAFLNTIERRITSQQLLIGSLKKYKRGVFEAFLAKKIRFTNRGTSFADWKWTTISEIGEFLGGLSGKTKDDFGHGSDRFITYMNVYKNAFATADGIMPVSIGSDERQNRIQYGDILFTQSSETVEEVGLSSVWLHNSKPYLNSFCMALRPNSLKQLNPKYLGYVMRSKSVRNQIMKEGQGISRINLSGNRILNVGFWCPSLDEQNKIVEVMESLDSICFLSDEKLTRLKDMKSSFIQQLFI